MVVLTVKDVWVQEDEKYVKIGMEIDWFVNVLFQFLGVKDVRVQEEALKAVVVICGFECYKSVLEGAAAGTSPVCKQGGLPDALGSTLEVMGLVGSRLVHPFLGLYC
ncbi:hypothetical protein Hanom_Chr17g01558371 [Helianthus anomalus]